MASITSKNNPSARRTSLITSNTSAARRKDLLGDEPVVGGASEARVSKRQVAAECLTIDDIFIPGSYYAFPLRDEVPAGYYFSEIADISIREKNGKTLLDVSYDIRGYDYENEGQEYQIKQAYALGSEHLAKFYDALKKAGVKPGASLRSAIGVQERIHLAYVSNNSDIGSIIARVPYHEGPDNDDSEFDDFLAEDDE